MRVIAFRGHGDVFPPSCDGSHGLFRFQNISHTHPPKAFHPWNSAGMAHPCAHVGKMPKNRRHARRSSTLPFLPRLCTNATSIAPVGFRLPPPILPMFFAGIPRKPDSRSIHCSRNCSRWTRIRELAPRLAINRAAITVFLNAVVADRTPVSLASMASAAAFCSGRSSLETWFHRVFQGSVHLVFPVRCPRGARVPTALRDSLAAVRDVADDRWHLLASDAHLFLGFSAFRSEGWNCSSQARTSFRKEQTNSINSPGEVGDWTDRAGSHSQQKVALALNDWWPIAPR